MGNARSFLLAWLSARSQGGQLLLRIEDIDSPRVKPWALNATLEDLTWLGLDWDNTGSHWVQTERLDRYQQVLDQLIALGRIYPCLCSRSEVVEAASAPHESSIMQLEGPVYPNTCRFRTFDVEELLANQTPFAYRFYFAEPEMIWSDTLRGRQHAYPYRQLGDFVIARSNGIPAYQLAVVVDDHDQGITEVIRGDDLVPSTFRQLSIMNALGWSPPRYAHLPLIIGPDGKRLAKRHGDTRLAWFREQKISPQALTGYLAWSAGLIERCQAVTPEELIGEFSWSKLSKEPTVFDLRRDLELLECN